MQFTELKWTRDFRVADPLFTDATYRLTCTSCHHSHRCSINYHRAPQHRSYFVAMSFLARPSSVQRVDQISRPMLDKCLNRSHPKRKYNCRQRPVGNIDDVCSSLDMNSTRPSMYHIVRSSTDNLHHRNRHQRRSNHRTRKCPSTTVSFPSVLCIAMHFSLDCIARPLRDPSHHHTYKVKGVTNQTEK